MEKKIDLIEPVIFRSGVVVDYSEKFVEDCYVDAYCEFAQGKSFCIEVVVMPEGGFQCRVIIFENPYMMKEFIGNYGEEKLIEIFYSSI